MYIVWHVYCVLYTTYYVGGGGEGSRPSGKSWFRVCVCVAIACDACDALRCGAMRCVRAAAAARGISSIPNSSSPRWPRARKSTTIIVSCPWPRVRMYVHDIAFYDVFIDDRPHLVNKPWIPIRGNAQEGGVAKPWRRTSCPRSALALGSTSPRAPTQLRTHARTHERTNETNPISRLDPPPQPPIYIHLYMYIYI